MRAREEEAARQATTGAARASAERVADPQQNGLLRLQQTYGNAAVSRLVQRKDAPASTDAPGAHHDKGHGKEPPKKAAADIHARVIKFDLDEGQALVTLTAGSEQGVQVGMPGSLLENGKEWVDFTVETVAGATCKTHVKGTQDQVNRGSDAIIKASKFVPPESQAGKEF